MGRHAPLRWAGGVWEVRSHCPPQAAPASRKVAHLLLAWPVTQRPDCGMRSAGLGGAVPERRRSGTGMATSSVASTEIIGFPV